MMATKWKNYQGNKIKQENKTNYANFLPIAFGLHEAVEGLSKIKEITL